MMPENCQYKLKFFSYPVLRAGAGGAATFCQNQIFDLNRYLSEIAASITQNVFTKTA
jgi:hypothetical protein